MLRTIFEQFIVSFAAAVEYLADTAIHAGATLATNARSTWTNPLTKMILVYLILWLIIVFV